jgi:hypothetical protein
MLIIKKEAFGLAINLGPTNVLLNENTTQAELLLVAESTMGHLVELEPKADAAPKEAAKK